MAESSPKLRPRRWRELSTLLSMDAVRPFFDMMGVLPDQERRPLELPGQRVMGGVSAPAEGLQSVLRGLVVDSYHRLVADPDTEVLSHLEVVSAVAAALGDRLARHLEWWNHHIFVFDSTCDAVAQRRWSTVLHHCRRTPGRWDDLGLPEGIGPRQFRSVNDLGPYRERQAEVDARPLSDWDLHLYARNLYDDNLYLDDPYRVPDGPRLLVAPTVRSLGIAKFWALVLSQYDEGRRDELWRRAARIAAEDEVLRSHDELPHPSSLDVLA